MVTVNEKIVQLRRKVEIDIFQKLNRNSRTEKFSILN